MQLNNITVKILIFFVIFWNLPEIIQSFGRI